jgi:hypothetical protein
MKKLILSGIFLLLISSAYPQLTKTDAFQDTEKVQPAFQTIVTTAILKSASRLFKDKDDLTSVIMVIPKDSIVDVLPGSYDTFLHVLFEGNEGFIYAQHAELSRPPDPVKPAAAQSSVQEQIVEQETRQVQKQAINRYEYLENKYGPSLAIKLYEGKIWKGMHSQLVKDSWGSPKKINRVISGNIVKEEWFYNNTWLYFQNSTLTEWGPAK